MSEKELEEGDGKDDNGSIDAAISKKERERSDSERKEESVGERRRDEPRKRSNEITDSLRVSGDGESGVVLREGESTRAKKVSSDSQRRGEKGRRVLNSPCWEESTAPATPSTKA